MQKTTVTDITASRISKQNDFPLRQEFLQSVKKTNESGRKVRTFCMMPKSGPASRQLPSLRFAREEIAVSENSGFG